MNHSIRIDPMPAPHIENPHDRPHLARCETCGKIACAETRQAASTRHYDLHGNRCRGYDIMQIVPGRFILR